MWRTARMDLRPNVPELQEMARRKRLSTECWMGRSINSAGRLWRKRQSDLPTRTVCLSSLAHVASMTKSSEPSPVDMENSTFGILPLPLEDPLSRRPRRSPRSRLYRPSSCSLMNAAASSLQNTGCQKVQQTKRGGTARSQYPSSQGY